MALPRLLHRFLTFALLLLLGATAPALAATIYVDDLNDGQLGDGTSTNPYRKLQVAIDLAVSGDTIFIRAGRHVAEPVEVIDPICGNCPVSEIYQDIPVKRGFHIANKSLALTGESRNNTILETRAGYGVYFENAGNSWLENVTVTGGLRDEFSTATSAAVVVRWTNLTFRNSNIKDNRHRLDGEGGVVAGIAGLVGREGAVITARNVWIYNNGWDGIALYRGHPEISNSGPRATIDNVDVDLGDGDGIGVTWDARADITNTRVSRYWKGVGAFGTARVTLRNSIVFDQEAWGVMAWGSASLTAINNVIAFQGRFGLGQWSPDATVTFKNNIVYANGQSSINENLGPRTGIWITNFYRATVQHNLLYANTLNNGCSGGVDNCVAHNFIGNGGNISADPMFVNTAEYNYTLRCGSPAINAGDPSLLDPDGTRSDIGAYGGPGSLQATSCFLPELQPLPITKSPSDPEAGDVVLFDSGVKNDSLSSSSYFNVKWFVGTNQASYVGHAGIPARTAVTDGNSAFSWTAVEGTHTITFRVDADNHVNEGNEANNVASLTLTVPPRRPDLTPTPITYIGTLAAGNLIGFDSGVRNLKSAGSNGFAIKWFVDGVQVGHGGHAGVPGNTTVMDNNSQYSWRATAGDHKITFAVDTGNQVAESNETNNSTSIMVRVQ